MKKNVKKILVTGGAGFIGYHLCNALCKSNKNHVIAIDNFFSGQIKNVLDLKINSNFEFFKRDVCKTLNFEIDEIYHLACPASPYVYQSKPLKTLITNVVGTLNVLELALKKNARILLASTSEIYGDPLQSPQRESYWGNVNPIGARSCYNEGKRCAETLFTNFNEQTGLKTKITRIFNTYGPRMKINDGRVVSNFINQALSNKEITIYGSGKQERSFCYIDDLIRGIISLMKTNKNISFPINLGHTKSISIKNLSKTINKMIDSKSELVFKDLPLDDPKKRKPDITLAKKHLGWSPKIDLNEGLKKTILYFKNN